MNEKVNVCLLNDSFPPLIDGVANAVVNYGEIIQEKYGKNSILKGMNLQEGGTTIQRNGEVGGHKG